MPDFVIHLLKANLSLVFFYLGYRLLLRRLTFYRLNRFYLLFGLLFSAVYPLVDISDWLVARQDTAPQVIYLISDWQQMPVRAFNWWPLLTALFWLGVIYFGWRLLVRLLSLRKLHTASQPAVWRLFRYRQVFHPVAPFTFWRNIYLNIHQHDEPELAEIFSHERIHAKELHTLDVLLAELCRTVCWFNPGAWLIRRAIHENLEYITDSNVLRQGVDKKTYQYHLLKVSQYTGDQPEIANHFNFKSLKRRIAMMNRKRSSALQLGNYVFALPVIAVLVLVFSVSRAYQQEPVVEEIGNRNSALPGPVAPPRSDTIHIRVDQPKDGMEAHHQPDEHNQDPSAATKPPGAVSISSPGRGGSGPVKAIFFDKADSARAPLIIVDGMPVKDTDSLQKMAADNIASISVWKDERLATSLYGKAAENGLVVIKMKPDTAAIGITVRGNRLDTAINAGATGLSAEKFAAIHSAQKPDFNGALIIIDGKESTAAAFRSLSTDKITSINVLKGNAAKEAYGDRGANGVIEVAVQ
ncbi:M56 family metallopeptidase [Parapedobacter lycopersici]|uniref:M56 family metallopeptidase n=1 Tax=Parapedobacter lycopersici TaxID=1864939 RepID=UPI00214D6583|nr:M56 family metallopeptidase [Parapedobacter lycopersici]